MRVTRFQREICLTLAFADTRCVQTILAHSLT